MMFIDILIDAHNKYCLKIIEFILRPLCVKGGAELARGGGIVKPFKQSPSHLRCQPSAPVANIVYSPL